MAGHCVPLPSTHTRLLHWLRLLLLWLLQCWLLLHRLRLLLLLRLLHRLLRLLCSTTHPPQRLRHLRVNALPQQGSKALRLLLDQRLLHGLLLHHWLLLHRWLLLHCWLLLHGLLLHHRLLHGLLLQLAPAQRLKHRVVHRLLQGGLHGGGEAPQCGRDSRRLLRRDGAEGLLLRASEGQLLLGEGLRLVEGLRDGAEATRLLLLLLLLLLLQGAAAGGRGARTSSSGQQLALSKPEAQALEQGVGEGLGWNGVGSGGVARGEVKKPLRVYHPNVALSASTQRWAQTRGQAPPGHQQASPLRLTWV